MRQIVSTLEILKNRTSHFELRHCTRIPSEAMRDSCCKCIASFAGELLNMVEKTNSTDSETNSLMKKLKGNAMFLKQFNNTGEDCTLVPTTRRLRSPNNCKEKIIQKYMNFVKDTEKCSD
ncbi:hypothetical protein GN956_G992 [Arapaima gigas]